MVSVVSPSSVARDRYQRCFASSIFDPPEEPKHHAAPAGKRRDQTVNELFGDAIEGKNLRFQQGTFEPKSDERSAREKKQEFLTSSVLPHTQYESHLGEGETAVDARHFSADPVERRLQENTSLIFNEEGKQVPMDPDCHARWAENKLRPTSFRWYQFPTPAHEEGDSAAVRALHEKRSSVFKEQGADESEVCKQAVSKRQQEEAEDRAIEKQMDEKRRNNCYYSDLFGRETPMESHPTSARHARMKTSPEDRITVHGDWSDSRTEIERGAQGDTKKTPTDRKLKEFHNANVFDSYEDPGKNFHPEPLKHHGQLPDVMDNAPKVFRHDHDSKVIHQAHMKSSIVDEAFYQDAAARTAWEVAEVHVSGLSPEENNESIAKKVKHAGFHVIRVNANMDPVNNTCKGTCRLQVRYNPDAQHHPIAALVKILEETYGLHAEI
jgi:hypothetical protein